LRLRLCDPEPQDGANTDHEPHSFSPAVHPGVSGIFAVAPVPVGFHQRSAVAHAVRCSVSLYQALPHSAQGADAAL
ncbi:hypothetical protein, partial [Bacillus subtilis]|uniref:hypothetical protein n=1 Tax=Bacillus subtilis TaxID=1423 RepID=UPI003C1D7D44